VEALEEDQRALLVRVARDAMLEYGLEPDFAPEVLAEADAADPATLRAGTAADLRDLLWCSIDNDDSLDLDQLTVARTLEDGRVTIMVAVADVSAAVPAGSAIDERAGLNTTTVYTPAQNFLMIPARLCNDLTSLNPGGDRAAVVVEMTVDGEGAIEAERVYRALVHNHAKLAYNGVGPWLEGDGPPPAALAAVAGLEDNLRLQGEVAQRLKARRHEQGALELETIEVNAQFEGGTVTGLAPDRRNRAKELIEDFMIAANGVVARFLEARDLPVVRRIVRSPERWGRIVALAAEAGEELPADPDSAALNAFLLTRRAADPDRFPDLSLTVIKLLGSGEYVASLPGQEPVGHFGLAVREYAHSTAPNRRYPDLITQRLVKAGLGDGESPYSPDELVALAAHCTEQEDAVQKVERRVNKSAAACYLVDHVGEGFAGIITGASPKGTWVRLPQPPVEGRVVEGEDGLDVGDRVRVRLVHVDPERGHIDFVLDALASHLTGA